MRKLVSAVLLGSAVIATPAIAAPAAGVAAPRPDAARERALQIARLLNDAATTEASAGKGFLEGLAYTVKNDSRAAAVEQAYPGFYDEFGQVMLPFFLNLLRTNLPLLWERQADFFVKTYTLPELDQIYAYYSSPSGRKLIALMNENFKGDALLERVDLAAGDKLTIDALDAGVQATLPAILARMTPADRKAMLDLLATPVGKKMMNAGPQLQAISVAWINEVAVENPVFKAEAAKQARAIFERRKSGGAK